MWSKKSPGFVPFGPIWPTTGPNQTSVRVLVAPERSLTSRPAVIEQLSAQWLFPVIMITAHWLRSLVLITEIWLIYHLATDVHLHRVTEFRFCDWFLSLSINCKVIKWDFYFINSNWCFFVKVSLDHLSKCFFIQHPICRYNNYQVNVLIMLCVEQFSSFMICNV